MPALIPYAYAGARLTLDELKTKVTWRGMDTEFARRVEALLVDGDGKVGIGTAWRSSIVQGTVFRQRHEIVAWGGCCSHDGKRWQLKPSMAHVAPPGRSFHEELDDGAGGVVSARAADMVGDWDWMEANLHRFGLKSFRNVGNPPEPWHIQPIEIPNSVSKWITAGRPGLTRFSLPGDQEDDMAIEVIRNVDDPDKGTYLANGIFKTWLDNGYASAAALKRCRQVDPRDVGNTECASFGPILGPIPPRHDAYGRYIG